MAWLLNRFFALYALCTLMSTNVLATVPQVTVTLKPVHSLVASVMEGIGEPTLILPDGASPHTFMLKPSTLKTLSSADLIIWVGPSLETFMVKPLSSLKPQYGFIEIDKLDNIIKLPLREGREWEHHDAEDSHEHDHHHDHGDFDPHLWLSTYNAKAIVTTTAKRLAQIDPQHAKQYQANAQKTLQQLQALKKTLQAQLASVQSEPFLVYHDGYQYFEKEFDLHGAGTMVLNPHLPLSANGLSHIKALIQDRGVKCVFKETEFSEKMIENSLGALPVQIRELDPLGVHFSKGPKLYEQTLLQIGNTMQECLSNKNAHK